MQVTSNTPSGLEGRTAVVTGAAAGIGRAVASQLRDLGMTVGALDLPGKSIPDDTIPLPADLRDTKAVTSAVQAFGAKYGDIWLLVGNAGVSFVGDIEHGEEADWQRILDINVLGQMRAVRAALPSLRKAGPGASIILIGSCSARNGIPERAIYSASKGAVHGLALALAADLVGEGIRVNCISPGTVDTPFMAELIERADDPAQQRVEFEMRQPTNKMVDAREVSLAVTWLANPINRSITGSVIEIDGGMGTIRLHRGRSNLNPSTRS